MSDEAAAVEPGRSSSAVRVLSIRLADELRAQLEVLAQLTGRTVTEEIRMAVEAWIARSKDDPQILQKAEAVRAEIERDAQSRRNAIAAIFDGSDGKEAARPTSSRSSGANKRA